MFGATAILVLLFVLFLAVIGRRNARRARSETPAERAARVRNENETAAILSIMDDH